MMTATEAAPHVRRALEECDCAVLGKLWRVIAPHLPQPSGEAETLIVLHATRTASASIGFRHRAWSHRWLTERGLPSGLPDALRPKAERLYPRIVEGVGVSVKARDPRRRAEAKAIEAAMAAAVAESYADGVTDPATLRRRMAEARRRVTG